MMTEESAFSRLNQMGVVVSDIEKAVAYYQSLGVEPFKTISVSSKDRQIYGKPAADIKLDVRTSHFGPLEIELIQPIAGNSIQKEFLDSNKGDGVQHLGFLVDDVEKAIAEMAKKGIKVIETGKYPVGTDGKLSLQGGEYPSRPNYAYFDTREVGGICFKVTDILPDAAGKDEGVFARPYQVAAVVRDMGRAIKYYQSLGIGPFSSDTGIVAKYRMVRGKPTPEVRLDIREAYIGPWSFELIQPAEDPKGESIQTEILKSKGEGFIHICFLVDDLEKEVVKLDKKGAKVLSSGKYPVGATGDIDIEGEEYRRYPTFVYMDTRKFGGFIFEVVQVGPNFMKEWESHFLG